MQRLTLSTDTIPEKERFSYWREHVNEQLIGVTSERATPSSAPFSARVEAHFGDALTHFRYRSDSFPAARGQRQIARVGWEDWIWLYQERGPGSWFAQSGQERVTVMGDFGVVDPTGTFTTDAHRGYDCDIWLFPRKMLVPHLPLVRLARGVHLAGDRAVNAIMRGYLDALSAQLGRLNDVEASEIADHASRLIAVACGAAGQEHAAAIDAARLVEVKRYVRQHLADPRLTPARVAATLRISIRQLHLLFEPTGTSFARYVLQQRLEECRATLAHPLWRDRSITDIALGWGFNSLATFYRTFRQAFGMTPSEWRAEADSQK